MPEQLVSSEKLNIFQESLKALSSPQTGVGEIGNHMANILGIFALNMSPESQTELRGGTWSRTKDSAYMCEFKSTATRYNEFSAAIQPSLEGNSSISVTGFTDYTRKRGLFVNLILNSSGKLVSGEIHDIKRIQDFNFKIDENGNIVALDVNRNTETVDLFRPDQEALYNLYNKAIGKHLNLPGLIGSITSDETYHPLFYEDGLILKHITLS